VLDVFNENPLPSSFEIKLKSDMLEPALVTQKAARIEQMPGVKEVQYGENWLSSLNNMSRAMKTGSMFFGCAIFIAVTFMMYSTIKIFYNKRKYNIETQKLLGAPRSFIRLPFMIEGLFVGTVSGFLSSFILFAVYSFTSLKIVEFIPSIGLVVTSLPMMVYISVPLAGAAMSIIGSLIAVGKISY
jgi:cell division transport system permease protein